MGGIFSIATGAGGTSQLMALIPGPLGPKLWGVPKGVVVGVGVVVQVLEATFVDIQFGAALGNPVGWNLVVVMPLPFPSLPSKKGGDQERTASATSERERSGSSGALTHRLGGGLRGLVAARTRSPFWGGFR